MATQRTDKALTYMTVSELRRSYDVDIKRASQADDHETVKKLILQRTILDMLTLSDEKVMQMPAKNKTPAKSAIRQINANPVPFIRKGEVKFDGIVVYAMTNGKEEEINVALGDPANIRSGCLATMRILRTDKTSPIRLFESAKSLKPGMRIEVTGVVQPTVTTQDTPEVRPTSYRILE